MVEYNRTEDSEETPRKKKKFLGIPIFALVIFSVVLVTAAVIYLTYTHSFTKTINVFSPEGSSEYVTISGTGDITSSVINCENQGAGCSVETGSITLSNSDTVLHNCTVVTTGNENVSISYLASNSSLITSPITVPAEGNITFKVKYQASVVGAYPMLTTINCLA